MKAETVTLPKDLGAGDSLEPLVRKLEDEIAAGRGEAANQRLKEPARANALGKLLRKALDLGCNGAALAVASALLSCDANNAEANRAIAVISNASGDYQQAIKAFAAAFRRSGDSYDLCEYAKALTAHGQADRPIAQIDRDLGLEPGRPPRPTALALVLSHLGRNREALAHIAAVARRGLSQPTFDMATAWVLARNRHPRAKQRLMELFERQPIWPAKKKGAAGSQVPVQVLVLANLPPMGAYVGKRFIPTQIYGGGNYATSLNTPRLAMNYGIIEGLRGRSALLTQRDIRVVLGNAMVETSKAVAETAEALCRDAAIPMLNPPLKVRGAQRDANYLRLKDRKDLVFPETRRYDPGTLGLAETARRISEEVSLPLILRPVATQYGSGMRLCRDQETLKRELAALAKSLQGREIFAIRFHDSQKSAGGYFKVWRCAWIDGALLPATCFFNNFWNTHGENDRLRSSLLRRDSLIDDAAYRAEEEAFLTDLPAYLGPAATAALTAAAASSGLDICGIDFGLTDDGRPLIFEMNPNMMLWWYRPGFPYFWPAADRIVEAMETTILRRAGID